MWKGYTISQLKPRLQERGLSTTGKKADLVARLEQYDREHPPSRPERTLTDKQIAKLMKQKLEEPPGITVVCVKVADIRPQYTDLQDWDAKSEHTYIGRGGQVFVGKGDDKSRYPPRDSKWANPFKIDKSTTREEVIDMYQTYVLQKLSADELDIEELSGQTLGCWCAPEPCHGDVLQDAAELWEAYVESELGDLSQAEFFAEVLDYIQNE